MRAIAEFKRGQLFFLSCREGCKGAGRFGARLLVPQEAETSSVSHTRRLYAKIFCILPNLGRRMYPAAADARTSQTWPMVELTYSLTAGTFTISKPDDTEEEHTRQTYAPSHGRISEHNGPLTTLQFM